MDNKNVILGSVAILFVVLFALILFAPKGKEAQAIKVDTSKIKVYKHIEKTEKEDGYYSQCKLDTDELVLVNKEFERAYSLTEENITNKKSINGDYKVVVDDKFLAFDKDSDVIYVGEKNKIYSFESKIYDIIDKACE